MDNDKSKTDLGVRKPSALSAKDAEKEIARVIISIRLCFIRYEGLGGSGGTTSSNIYVVDPVGKITLIKR